jgi:hypothetical protein
MSDPSNRSGKESCARATAEPTVYASANGLRSVDKDLPMTDQRPTLAPGTRTPPPAGPAHAPTGQRLSLFVLRPPPADCKRDDETQSRFRNAQIGAALHTPFPQGLSQSRGSGSRDRVLGHRLGCIRRRGVVATARLRRQHRPAKIRPYGSFRVNEAVSADARTRGCASAVTVIRVTECISSSDPDDQHMLGSDDN